MGSIAAHNKMVAEEVDKNNENAKCSNDSKDDKTGYMSSAKHLLHIAVCLIMAVCVHQVGVINTMGDLVQERILSQGLGFAPTETIVVEEAVEEALNIAEEVVEVVDETIKTVDKKVEEIKEKEDEVKATIEEIEIDAAKLVEDVNEVIKETVEIVNEVKDDVKGIVEAL